MHIWLTIIEVLGIQDYIFGSNQLSQNIGASERVAQVSNRWLAQTIVEVLGERTAAWVEKNADLAKELGRFNNQHNARWDNDLMEIALSDPSAPVAIEFISAAGGNVMALFQSLEMSQKFVRALTRKALRLAPGLRLTARTRRITNWEPLATNGLLATAITLLRRRDYPPAPVSTPLLGLGVTAACDYTALPVYGAHRQPDSENRQPPPKPIPISRLVAGKLGWGEKQTGTDPKDDCVWESRERLEHNLPLVQKKGYEFISDFDQFGEPNETSYIAVIHIDGNGMGERLLELAAKYPKNDDYRRELRKFSQAIKDTARYALRRTVEALFDSVDQHPEKGDLFGGVVKAQKDYLPFRPLVFGGDDVTFVADGRLGLSLAATYLRALDDDKQTLPDAQKLYSRAGVAVVKNHFPFSRAYALAEALCRSAKAELPSDKRGFALDWHFATSGTILELDELRLRNYATPDNKTLLMRPVVVTQAPQAEWRNWLAFEAITLAFKDDERWRGRRNKVKALREALRAGPAGGRQFLENHQVESGFPVPNAPRLLASLQTTLARIPETEKRLWGRYLPYVQRENSEALRRLIQAAFREQPQPQRPLSDCLAHYGLDLNQPEWQTAFLLMSAGWDNAQRCAYYDAIEAADFFVAVE